MADGATGENTTEHTAGGTIKFADVDTIDTHTATVAENGNNYLGTLTLGAVNAADKSLTWDFKVDDSVLDSLGAGQKLTQTYTVTIADGKGGTVTQDIVLTITGTNDAPTITSGAQAGSVTEVADGATVETTTEHTAGGIDCPPTSTRLTPHRHRRGNGNNYLGTLTLGALTRPTRA